MPQDAIQNLLRQRKLWRGVDYPVAKSGLTTGWPALDTVLPQGGWPASGVIEITVSNWGIGEFSLFLPLMRHYNGQGRYISWIAPPHIPYAPALAAAQIDLNRCRVLLNPDKSHHILWCVEKLMRTSECGLVMAWPWGLTDRAVRRLQLAAEEQGTCCLLWRTREHPHPWNGSAAGIRLNLEGSDQGLRVNILKARGTCKYPVVVLQI